MKVWIALILAVISTVIGGVALCRSFHEYSETTRPLSLQARALNAFELLESILKETDDWVTLKESIGLKSADYDRAILTEAQQLASDARREIISGHYLEAEELIRQSSDRAPPMGPLYAPEDAGLSLGLWLIVGIGSALSIGITLFLLVIRRRIVQP